MIHRFFHDDTKIQYMIHCVFRDDTKIQYMIHCVFRDDTKIQYMIHIFFAMIQRYIFYRRSKNTIISHFRPIDAQITHKLGFLGDTVGRRKKVGP